MTCDLLIDFARLYDLSIDLIIVSLCRSLITICLLLVSIATLHTEFRVAGYVI